MSCCAPSSRNSITWSLPIGPLDRAAIRKAARQTGLPEPDCAWIDTMRVAQRTWPDLAEDGGHALANCVRALRIVPPSSRLAGQARCAGQILARALSDTGLGLQDWIDHLAAANPPARATPTEDSRGGGRHFVTIRAGTPQWTQWSAWFAAMNDERARLFTVLDRVTLPTQRPPAVQTAGENPPRRQISG
jgi:hypothetical protein